MLDLDTLATRMLRDYDRHTPGTPFADGLHLSIDEAYRLQSRVAQRREARDEQVVGYKSLCLAGDGNRSKKLDLYNVRGYDITHAWPTSARDRRATNATS